MFDGFLEKKGFIKAIYQSYLSKNFDWLFDSFRIFERELMKLSLKTSTSLFDGYSASLWPTGGPARGGPGC